MLGGWNALYLDCISVNSPGGDILLQFERCYHWGKKGKGCLGLSAFFLTTVCDSIIILNGLIKNLIEWKEKVKGEFSLGLLRWAPLSIIGF